MTATSSSSDTQVASTLQTAVAARRRPVAAARGSRIRQSLGRATRREVAPRPQPTGTAAVITVAAAPQARARKSTAPVSRPSHSGATARRAARIRPDLGGAHGAPDHQRGQHRRCSPGAAGAPREQAVLDAGAPGCPSRPERLGEDRQADDDAQHQPRHRALGGIPGPLEHLGHPADAARERQGPGAAPRVPVGRGVKAFLATLEG